MESELDRLRQKVENFPSPSAYTRFAELLRAQGNIDGAVESCQRCIKEFPRTGQAYVILAEIDMVAGRKDEGIRKLQTATVHDPRNYSAHRMLADHFGNAGQNAQALIHLRQILTFKPNDPEVLKRISDLTPKGSTSSQTPSQTPSQTLSQTLSQTIAKQPVAASASASAAIGGSSGKRPTTAIPAAKPAPQGLAPLVAEAGVRGALIADAHGRVVSSAGLDRQLEDVLAAVASEFGNNTSMVLESSGQGTLIQWMLAATQGQVMAFKRDNSCSVVVLAEPGVRPALLEIRARQALTELGAV